MWGIEEFFSFGRFPATSDFMEYTNWYKGRPAENKETQWLNLWVFRWGGRGKRGGWVGGRVDLRRTSGYQSRWHVCLVLSLHRHDDVAVAYLSSGAFIYIFFSCSTDRPAGRPRHDVAVRLDARALLRRPVAGSEWRMRPINRPRPITRTLSLAIRQYLARNRPGSVGRSVPPFGRDRVAQ